MSRDSNKEPFTNSLLECASGIFALVSPFRSANRGAELPEDYRSSIVAAFDVFDRMAFEYQIPHSPVQDAKLALAAYIDETVLSSDWPGRMAWMERPLQMELFGEHLAGEKFYSRLAELRQGGESNMELLELFYVCLQLGFEGIYRIRGLEQLMALQVDLRRQIEDYRGLRDGALAPDGIPDDSFLGKVRREVPYWVVAAVSAAIVFVVYLGYGVATSTMVSSNADAIANARALVVKSMTGNAAVAGENQ